MTETKKATLKYASKRVFTGVRLISHGRHKLIIATYKRLFPDSSNHRHSRSSDAANTDKAK